MAYPVYEEWGSTLSDWYGPWCAWCLKTIEPHGRNDLGGDFPGRFQWSHSIRAELFQREFATTTRWGPVVPTHAGCHDALEGFSKVAKANLEILLSLSPERKSSASRILHETSNHWGALLLKISTAVVEMKDGDFDALRTSMQRAIGSIAALPMSSLPRRISRLITPVSNDPGVLFQKVAWHENHDRPRPAKNCLLLAKRGSGADPSEEMNLIASTRTSHLSLDPADARRTCEMAKDHPHTRYTSRMLLGWSLVRRGETRGRSSFEEIITDAGVAPWMYVGDSHTMKAVEEIRETNRLTNETYKSLVLSQYIYGILGIRSISRPDLSFVRGADRTTKMPGDVILALDEAKSAFPAVKCLELREQALGGAGMFPRLMRVICSQDERLSELVKPRRLWDFTTCGFPGWTLRT